MITADEAYNWVCDLDADQIRALTASRILGEDTTPVGDGYLEEPSEDLVIQLLRKPDLPAEIRSAVVSGCRAVYARVLASLAAPHASDTTWDPAEVAIRLCRVVDVAAPEELVGHANAMLNLVLSVPNLESRIVTASVRASMAFGRTPDHIPLWERVLQRKEVAAYAFNALLEIDPEADRIEEALETLREKRVHEGWNIDTEFLTQRVHRVRASLRPATDSAKEQRPIEQQRRESRSLASSAESKMPAERTVVSPPLPQNLVEAEELAAAIEAAVWRETDQRVRGLRVKITTKGALLTGRCSTSYVKGQAQRAAKSVSGAIQIINRIEVR